jgi:hypothetical protein
MIECSCGASCHVVANSENEAVRLQGVEAYFKNFGVDHAPGLDCEQVPSKEEIIFVAPGMHIAHTAEEWAEIYDICGPIAFCFSEY